MTRTLAVAAALISGVVAIRVAAAEPPPGISVVAGERGALAARLAEELRAAGLSVRVDATERDSKDNGIIILMSERDDGPIEVWSRRDSGSELLATVPPEGPIDERVLRAAELVRALALPPKGARSQVVEPLPANAQPAPLPQPPPPERRDALPRPPPLLPERAPPLMDFGVAPALGITTQGPSLGVQTSVRLWPSDWVGIGVLADLPIIGARISAPEGAVDVHRAIFGLELEAAPAPRNERLGMVVAPGAGFTYVDFGAEPGPGFQQNDESAFAAFVYGRVEGRLRVLDWFLLTAGGLGGAAFPAIEVRFGGRAVSTISPAGAISIGVLAEL